MRTPFPVQQRCRYFGIPDDRDCLLVAEVGPRDGQLAHRNGVVGLYEREAATRAHLVKPRHLHARYLRVTLLETLDAGRRRHLVMRVGY